MMELQWKQSFTDKHIGFHVTFISWHTLCKYWTSFFFFFPLLNYSNIHFYMSALNNSYFIILIWVLHMCLCQSARHFVISVRLNVLTIWLTQFIILLGNVFFSFLFTSIILAIISWALTIFWSFFLFLHLLSLVLFFKLAVLPAFSFGIRQ